MKTIKASIEFLSPVHVGSGEEIIPVEYFLQDNFLYKVNPFYVVSLLDTKEREEFLKLMQNINEDKLISLRKFLISIAEKKGRDKISDFKIPVSDSIKTEYNQKIGSLNNELRIMTLPVNGIRREAYLPGSSLKGALRTAIVSMFAKQRNSNPSEFRDLRNNSDKYFESNLLGYDRNIRRDFFRLLKIPDIFLDADKTEILSCHNWNPRKSQEGIPMRLEVTSSRLYDKDKNKAYDFEIRFHEEVYQRTLSYDRQKTTPNKKEEGITYKFTIEELGTAANEFFFQTLDHELKVFYADTNTYSSQNELRTLRDTMAEDEFLIRLGRFGHIETKTIDRLRNPQVRFDHKNTKSFGWGGTRTITDKKLPLGWALIKIPGMKFGKPQNNLPAPTGHGLNNANKVTGTTLKEKKSSQPFNQPPSSQKSDQKSKGGGYGTQNSPSTYSPFANLKQDKDKKK